MNFRAPIFTTALSMVMLFIGLSATAQDGSKAESIEDWETGDFSSYEWQFEGNADWFISDMNPYEGVYSAQSGDINDNQTSTLYLEYNVYDEDTLSFWYRVSSESGWDYLKFYIDDLLQEEWSGEIPWSLAEFVVPVGVHTLKWEYYKDFSISNGADAAWIDLISFPPEEVEAYFVADTTVVCLGDIVFFTDLSVGPITEWNWVFEGALPVTSSDQNPVVGYNQVGEWDVFLEVSDGIETDSYYAEKYMTVSATPTKANMPSGISSLCASWGNSTYSTVPMGGGVTDYDWVLTPTDAGIISGNGSANVTILWDEDFLGDAELKVGGINYCGVGQYSDPLIITRYLPDVLLVLPAYVALPEPAFELTGGFPAGGEYSGPGVSNGWFDPATAGMGAHTITYTYTDVNWCSNSATDVITVTEFIDVEERFASENLKVYPNPGNGKFTIRLDAPSEGSYDLKIFNAVNKMVYHEKDFTLNSGIEAHLNTNLETGMYFIKLTGGSGEFTRKLVVQK